MTCLITIFNVNDPTPTALSIRSHNPSEINILVIGRTEFTKQQQKAMKRFKKWMTGSIRPDDFPEHFWLPELDWEPLHDIKFHDLDDIKEFDTSMLQPNTTIDLMSGSKEMNANLMQKCMFEGYESLHFTVTQPNGTIIDISTGEASEPCSYLEIPERIWLSTGKIAKLGSRASQEIGTEIKNWEEVEETTNKKKFIPKNMEMLYEILGVPDDSEEGTWLEIFTSSCLSTHQDVKYVWNGLAIYPSDWASMIAIALSKTTFRHDKIGYKLGTYVPWPYGYDGVDEEGRPKRKWVDDMKLIIEWKKSDQMAFFSENKLSEDQLQYIWRNAWSNEIDVVALLNDGRYLFVECKYRGNEKSTAAGGRLLSNTKMLGQRGAVILVVHSSKQTQINNRKGIPHVNWLDVSSERIIDLKSLNWRRTEYFHEGLGEEDKDSTLFHGKVIFFNQKYGFIENDDLGNIFVHSTGVKEGEKINANDLVKYNIVEGRKGPKAENVVRIRNNT